MNSLTFLLFFLFLALLGRGVFIVLKKWLCDPEEERTEVFLGVHELALYPFFGLISLGVLALIMNFFMGVASIWFVYAVTALLALNILPTQHQRLFSDRRFGFAAAAIILLLSIALHGVVFSYDAGLYHLQHQLWIREEEIVFGFANIHSRYGFSSFQEYIAAPLWLHNDLTIVAAINVAFTAAFLIYIAALICGGYAVYARIGVFLAAFGAWALWSDQHLFFSIQNVGSVDSAAGILYLIAFICVAIALLTRDFKPTTVAVCGIFSVAAFFMKPSGVFVGVLFGSYLIHGAVVLGPARITKQHLLAVSMPVALMILWSVRGLITTGCLAFPIEASCLPLPWAATSDAHDTSAIITAWARAPRTGLESLEGWGWIGEPWWPRNSATIMQFPIALGVGLLCAVLAYRNKGRRIDKRDIVVSLSLLGFAAATMIVWFVFGPDRRFAPGFFAAFGVAICIFFSRRDPETIFPRYSIAPSLALFVLLAVSVAMIPNHSRGKFKIAAKPLKPPVVAYRERPDAYGVEPIKRNQCWVQIDCYPGRNRVTIEKFFGPYDIVVREKPKEAEQ